MDETIKLINRLLDKIDNSELINLNVKKFIDRQEDKIENLKEENKRLNEESIQLLDENIKLKDENVKLKEERSNE